MGSTQMYSLAWGEFSTCLSSTVQILRGHGEMVDVTLAAGGRIFPAHKLVLSAASPLLMELLKSTGCQHPVVMLAGITAQDLEALLEFVYMGEVSIDPSQLPSLLQAAHCLDIQALSSASLTSEKSNLHASVGVCTDNGLPQDVDKTLVPVKKRKRKQKQTSENGLPVPAKWPHMESANENMENNIPGTFDHPVDVKEEPTGMDENSSKQKKIINYDPVNCTVCGVTLKRSRNLPRHMEVKHGVPKTVNKKSRKKKQKMNGDREDPETVSSGLTPLDRSSLQPPTLSEPPMQSLTSGDEGPLPAALVPSQDSVAEPGTSSCDTNNPYSSTTLTEMPFPQDDLSRQENDDLRSDTREHCQDD